jgi:zinc transporter ZupT
LSFDLVLETCNLAPQCICRGNDPFIATISLSHAVGCCCAGFAVVVAARRYGPNLMGNGGFNKAEESSDLRLRRLGIITAITLTCHNLPEGMAVALSTMGSTHLGLRMAFAIALHNIPEGLAIAGPLMMSRKTSRLSAIGLALASGLSEPVGALMTLIFFKHFITEVRASPKHKMVRILGIRVKLP